MSHEPTDLIKLRRAVILQLEELHRRATEPFDLKYGALEIELRPAEEGARLEVMVPGQGAVRLNWTGEGLVIDVYAQDEEIPFQSSWFDLADLQPNIPDEDL